MIRLFLGFLQTRLGFGIVAGLVSIVGVQVYLSRRDARVAASVINKIEKRNEKGIKAANSAGRKSRSRRVRGQVDPNAQ